MADKPEHTIKVGGIQIALWSNTGDKGTLYSVTMDRSYKDNDKWKRSKTFRINDLVKIQLGINKLLEYLYIKDAQDVISTDSYVKDSPKKVAEQTCSANNAPF